MLDYNIKTSDYMYMIITHECNRSCPFCIDKYRGRKEFISDDTVKKYIEFAKEKNIKIFTLVGGEPLLHPNIVNICKTIKNAGLNIVLTTNADNLFVMKKLDGIVDSFNVSYYDQNFDSFLSFSSDVTLSVLLWKDRFKTLNDLNIFLNEMNKLFHFIKFKAIEPVTIWAKKRSDISSLISQIPFKKEILLFNAVNTSIYKGFPFGISVVDSANYEHAYKGQIDGFISKY